MAKEYKCKKCGKKFPKFNMKSSTECNICAYFRHSKEELQKLKKPTKTFYA